MSRDSLARMIGRTPANEDHIQDMGAAAYHQRDYLGIPMGRIRDPIELSFLRMIGDRLYGPNRKDVTHGSR